MPVTDASQEAVAVIALFSERLNKLMDSAGFLSARDGRFSALGAKYGVSRQQAHRWCTGRALPAPHILIRIANDFHCSLDWLLGRYQNCSGTIPIFKAQTSVKSGNTWGFVLCGSVAVSPVCDVMENFVVVQNWSASVDPDLQEEDWLLLRLGCELEDDGTYIIQTTIGTIGVAKAKLSQDKSEVTFSRQTQHGLLFCATFRVKDVALNHQRQINMVWRGGGVQLLGKVISVTRSLGVQGASFFCDIGTKNEAGSCADS